MRGAHEPAEHVGSGSCAPRIAQRPAPRHGRGAPGRSPNRRHAGMRDTDKPPCPLCSLWLREVGYRFFGAGGAGGSGSIVPADALLLRGRSRRDGRVEGAGRDGDVQLDVLQLEHRGVAAGERHRQLCEHVVARHPELQPVQPLLDLLPLRQQVHLVAARRGRVRDRANRERPPQLPGIRVGEVLVHRLHDLGDVGLLDVLPAGARHEQALAVHEDRPALGRQVGDHHPGRLLADERALRHHRLDQQRRGRRLDEPRADARPLRLGGADARVQCVEQVLLAGRPRGRQRQRGDEHAGHAERRGAASGSDLGAGEKRGEPRGSAHLNGSHG